MLVNSEQRIEWRSKDGKEKLRCESPEFNQDFTKYCGGAEKRSVIFVIIVISLSLYTNFGEDIALYRSWEALEHKLNVLSWIRFVL